MARALRINLPGGWYHVINRGIERRRLFETQSDYKHFLELLGELPERFGVMIHAFVLMPNHYHLQLETTVGKLSQALHWLNVSYSVWFNRRHRRVGPLFQGRFKAHIHEKGGVALTINRYIHLNPVRLKRFGTERGAMSPAEASERNPELAQELLMQLRAYRWSSYGCYAGVSHEYPAVSASIRIFKSRFLQDSKLARFYRRCCQYLYF
jgi:REP-associated tyrosine transposase